MEDIRMIIKKTVMTLLLILTFIWQGTSLYGMHRFVARQSTELLSRKLSNLMTRRSYCNSPKKGTDPMKKVSKRMDTMQKNLDSLGERVYNMEAANTRLYSLLVVPSFRLSFLTIACGLSLYTAVDSYFDCKCQKFADSQNQDLSTGSNSNDTN